MSGSAVRHCMTRIGILLIAAVLIATTVGCVPVQYTLSVGSSEGGRVVTPGEGTFTYNPGRTVSLVAEAEEGYCFARWYGYLPGYIGGSGNLETIEDLYAATTTVTMNGDYDVTAYFVEGIRDWYDLNAVRYNLHDDYVLMNSLDSTTPGYQELASPTANGGKGWQPIGVDPFNGYVGTFDGRGYEIRDLYINRPDESHVGLFGAISDAGIIKNTGVAANVTGYSSVGGLVGVMMVLVDYGPGYGTVSGSYSRGNVVGYSSVGGLVGGMLVSKGYNDDYGYGTDYGTVSNSYSRSSVSGSEYVGGLVGTAYANKAVVSDSYFTGSINGDEWAGGLVGWSSLGAVYNSFYDYDEVSINGENIITVGALCSEDFNEWLANDKFLDVDNSLSQGDGYYLINDVTDFKQLLAFGQDSALKFRLTDDLDLASEPNFYIPYLAGEFDGNGHETSNLSFEFGFISQVGLFGYLAPGGSVTDLAADNVSITGDDSIGGLIGYNLGTVSNSRSAGDISGDDWDTGGLVGSNGGTVSGSYSAGNVSGDYRVGGLVGCNYHEVSNSCSTSSVTGGAEVGGLVGENND
jgi:Divergent InlB B-repeat domain/The GLUG motif